MSKLLFIPAILGVGLFLRNKDRVAVSIDDGTYTDALIYGGAGVVGIALGIAAVMLNE